MNPYPHPLSYRSEKGIIGFTKVDLHVTKTHKYNLIDPKSSSEIEFPKNKTKLNFNL